VLSTAAAVDRSALRRARGERRQNQRQHANRTAHTPNKPAKQRRRAATWPHFYCVEPFAFETFRDSQQAIFRLLHFLQGDLAKRSRAAQPDVAIRIMLAQFVQRAQNALFGFPAILREG